MILLMLYRSNIVQLYLGAINMNGSVMLRWEWSAMTR